MCVDSILMGKSWDFSYVTIIITFTTHFRYLAGHTATSEG